MTNIHRRLSQLTKMAILEMAIFTTLFMHMTMLIDIVSFNGPIAQASNARDTRLVVSSGDFRSILSWNCSAVAVTKTGPLECLKECADWDGTRCYAYAYDNETCWICDDEDQYTTSPSYVVAVAHTFGMSDRVLCRVHLTTISPSNICSILESNFILIQCC